MERVEVKDVRVPEQLMRAMAAEAEAAREARAKVIAAEGEHKASRALRQAAEVIVDSPAALQVFICLHFANIETNCANNQETLQIFCNVSVEIFANPEQYFCGEQLDRDLPGASGHHQHVHDQHDGAAPAHLHASPPLPPPLGPRPRQPPALSPTIPP